MENPSPEITKVASTVSKSDVKKMASTKHKGLPEKKKIEEVAFLAAAGKVALAAGKGAVKQKAKQVVKQKAANVAQGAIPQPNRDQQQEGVGRAAIGAGIGAMVGGPVGAAVGGSIGAAMGKKKKVTTGGKKVKKKATNFFKAEPKVTSSEGVVAFVKKGLERDKKAKKEKDIKNRKAVPYAALAAEHQPEGEELKEYSPNVTYQDKKKGKLGKSSIYSLRDKDESKKDFRKSHVKDVEDGYVGKGHKPTPGSLKKEDWKPEITHSKMGDATKKAAEKKKKEAQKGLPPHLQGDWLAKARKAFKENYRVLARDKGDKGRPAQFSYKDENDAKKFADSIKSKGGKATVAKEENALEKRAKDNEKARKFLKKDAKDSGYTDIALKASMSKGAGVSEGKETAKLAANILRDKEPCAECGSVAHVTGQCPKKDHDVSEGVMDIVNRYKKKKEEKKPQKAQDAGARARRVLKRREYQSKVSAIVPAELEDHKVWDRIKKIW
jgi:hypothetical protein